MLILHDSSTLKHETVELLGGKLMPALESPTRITAILEALAESRAGHRVVDVTMDEDNRRTLYSLLSMTHDDGYLNHLETSHRKWVQAGHIEEHESILPECFPSFSMPHHHRDAKTLRAPQDLFARSGFYAFDMSTGIMKDTYEAALASANLAVLAATNVSDYGIENAVVALCRPPGHHCDTTKAGGYCYLNNCVLAASAILSQLEGSSDHKVVILDVDFHHGNGTQSFFYGKRVRYVSIHGEDEYPYYSGSEQERGHGEGEGYNHNFPLKQKTSEAEYLATLKRALEVCLQSVPSHLILSLGFDTFHLDPLGSFNLHGTSFTHIGQMISEAASRYNVRALILLEGGYVVESIGENLLNFLQGWSAGRG